MVEFLDRRYVPELEKLAREVADARWRRTDRAFEDASKRFRRLKAQWAHERDKFFTPETIRAIQCPLGVITILPAPTIEPREVDAIPSSMIEQPDRPADPHRCYRCGSLLDAVAGVFELEVGTRCFGKEIA